MAHVSLSVNGCYVCQSNHSVCQSVSILSEKELSQEVSLSALPPVSTQSVRIQKKNSRHKRLSEKSPLEDRLLVGEGIEAELSMVPSHPGMPQSSKR